ncbi:MAG: hypothetical protein IPH44_36265 [Myxococcales bacterium]|nr:hypothetical protein [Myxococcales bacterium]
MPAIAARGAIAPNAPLAASQVAGSSAHTRGVPPPSSVSATGTAARSPPPRPPTSIARSASPVMVSSTCTSTLASEPSGWAASGTRAAARSPPPAATRIAVASCR